MSNSRRDVISKFLTVVAMVPLAGAQSCRKEIEESSCSTSKDILGPFYREDSPSRTDLNVNGRVGTLLNISGVVFGEDCVTPLSNATIEVWHADDSGAYDNSTDDFEFRGVMNSDSNGQYGFSTIVPGRYLNGNSFRPGHIHFKVSATGHQALVTQLYFQGDPFIGSDPWASDEEAEGRVIALETDDSGVQSGVFDITLNPV